MQIKLFYQALLVSGLLAGLSMNIFAGSDSNSISSFKQSWLAKALELQREIDINAPLSEATFIGTHNSYNSKSYQIPFVRYIDPNQVLSVYDQLEMGIRSIEFDAHWTFNSYFTKEILLCHGQASQLGCSLFDRKFTEGLQEIRDWLSAHPHELVLIYIETFLEGHEDRLAEELDEYLGDFIYKPKQVKKQGPSRGCIALPGFITKAEILKANKQLIVVTKQCNLNPHVKDLRQHFNDLVFTGIGDISSKPFSFIDAGIDDFIGLPECGKSTIFAADKSHTSLWRIFEDRTFLSNIEHKHKKLLSKDMQELNHCGINWPAMDMLSTSDERLNATIWSWSPNYPQENSGQCAIYKKGVGMQNVSCMQIAAGYACQEEKTHNIDAIALKGVWSDGETMCQQYAGKNWHFFVPVNGNQMNLLKNNMKTNFMLGIWLNYVNINGRWIANPPEAGTY